MYQARTGAVKCELHARLVYQHPRAIAETKRNLTIVCSVPHWTLN